jgi:hypothetical protein
MFKKKFRVPCERASHPKLGPKVGLILTRTKSRINSDIGQQDRNLYQKINSAVSQRRCGLGSISRPVEGYEVKSYSASEAKQDTHRIH